MDEIDRKIISQLQLDGRTTLKDLSRIVGYTSMGVKKRVENLLEQDVIKISALLNMEPLKLCAAILFLEIESAQAMDKLLERFRNCPRVVHIFTTLGGYNLIALVVAEDRETLESISIEKCSLRSSEGIRRSEFYTIGGVEYSPFLSVREHLTHKEKTISPCNVDCEPCQRYQNKKCVGCPATTYYRGTL
ncbi:MAG: winged helix-turn-helix transcriptional regulator [Candidatus Bathyarchaeota archaeon]|nr:winged helix-turn-helix transcriptional regulator [Candidatus Bathyarchaeota archaeon]